MLGKSIILTSLLGWGAVRAQEHVFPDEYFPAYPGSWWKYETQAGDTVVDSTAGKYGLFSWLGKETVFLPYLVTSHWGSLNYAPRNSAGEWDGNRLLWPIRGTGVSFKQCSKGNYCFWVSKPIHSLEAGRAWEFGGSVGFNNCVNDSSYGCVFRRVKAVDTSVTVLGKTFDSVIVMRTRAMFTSTYDSIDEYYSKHVGLVKAIGCYWNEDIDKMVCTTSLNLVDYFINRNARISQVIRIDSFENASRDSMNRWGNASSFAFPKIQRAGIKFKHTGASGIGDTVTLKATSSAGLPLEFESTGPVKYLGEGKFFLPNRFGTVLMNIRQPGNLTHEPAAEFNGIICLHPKISMVVEPHSDGGVRISTGYAGSGFWERRAFESGDFKPLSDTGSSILTRLSGVYIFKARNPEPDTVCGVQWSQVYEISLPEAVDVQGPGPPRVGVDWLMIFGVRVPGPAPSVGKAMSVTVHRHDGRPVPNLRMVSRGEIISVEAEGDSEAVGVYLYQACIGSVCRSGKIAAKMVH